MNGAHVPNGLATSVYLVDRIPWYTARPNCRVYAQPRRKDLTVTHFYERKYCECSTVCTINVILLEVVHNTKMYHVLVNTF